VNRADELRAIYDRLKATLGDADGSGAASIARELRILSAELEAIDKTGKVNKVDEVAARRRARAGASDPPSRRRQPG
jgi:hypothetical protein